MVVVELGGVEDAAEREDYLSFLAENEITFVRSDDGASYLADIAFLRGSSGGVDDEDDAEREYFSNDLKSKAAAAAKIGPNGGHRMPSFSESSFAAASVDARAQMVSPRSRRGGPETILAGSRPSQETRRMLKAFRSSGEVEDFSTYSKFCSLIEMRDRLEPKPRSLKWLMGLVNDVYDDRLSMNSKYDREELRVFPVFVMDHLTKRYGLRQIVDQVAWDMVLSVHTHRRHRIDVEVFARFLEEYYDTEDLKFFIRVRSVVENIVQRSIRTSWAKENASQRSSATSIRSDAQVYLKWHEVESVAKHVFNSSALSGRQESFLSLVDENSVPLTADAETEVGSTLVEVSQLLHLAVAQNHDIRAQSISAFQTFEETQKRDRAMHGVFEKARSAYHKKLRELGFAATAAHDQLGKDLHQQRRLDEMCHAIKRALMENESTRDSLPDVSEATIREWAVGLMAREVESVQAVVSSRLSGSKSDASAEILSKTLRGKWDSLSGPMPDTNSTYTRRSGKSMSPKASSPPLRSPSPPRSPRPQPPSRSASSFDDAVENEEDFVDAVGMKSEYSEIEPEFYDHASATYSMSKFSNSDSREIENKLSQVSLSSTSPRSIPGFLTVTELPPDNRPPSRPPPVSPEANGVGKSKGSDSGSGQQQLRIGSPLSQPPPSVLSPPPSFMSEPAGWGLAYDSAPQRHLSRQDSTSDAQNIMREIHMKLERAKEAYLSSLMSSARDLPQTILYEIEEEVRAQLDQHCRRILNDIVLGRRATAQKVRDNDLLQRHTYEQLVAVYKNILRLQRANDYSYMNWSRQVDDLCEGILHTTELRQEIEPLVALLSTYANAKLGKNRSNYL
mmetsp:Transcript_16348/g.31755  ORF Transcript_16348/g.31755 Transcript_16348/m.31755 type:complete len:847 (-) Transcript_16348:53-2593(-)